MTLLLWVAGSFIAGFLSGVVGSDAIDLYRASRKERQVPTTRITNRVLTVGLYVALVLNFCLGLMLIQQRATVTDTARDLATYTRCTNDWQQQFAAAYEARYEAAVLVSEAMDGVVTAVANRDPETFKTSIRRYIHVRQDQNAERKRTPLPPLPDQLCGSAPKGND